MIGFCHLNMPFGHLGFKQYGMHTLFFLGARSSRIHHMGFLTRAVEYRHQCAQCTGYVLHVKHDAMNRMNRDTRVIEINHLTERIAKRALRAFLRRHQPLAPIPNRLGRSQRMITVAHREQHIVSALRFEPRKRVLNATQHRRIVDKPALNMASVLHQRRAVYLRELFSDLINRRNHGILDIVDQQHDMGTFQHCILAQANANGQSLGHRSFRGANQRLFGGIDVVLLKIDCEHHTNACAMRRFTLHHDDALRQAHEHAILNVIAHCLFGMCDSLAGIPAFQEKLRNDDMI